LEERFNRTQTLDELKELESELQRQNEEDRAVIQDENTTLSAREATETGVAERNEDLARLQTQTEERERALSLAERIKEIFKKYGVTVTATFLAAGITIGADRHGYKCFEGHRQSFVGRPKRNRHEAWGPAPRADIDRPGRELSFQNGREGGWLSRRAHLASDLGGCCLYF